MAADNPIDRIAGLVDRLGPLSGKTRGMRIEADEWNTLIAVVLGTLQVERGQVQSAQTQLEERFALRTHQHLGEVTTGWLDAELQARAGGQDSSLSARGALADMERKIASLGAEVGRLTALVDGQQKLIDRSAVDELDRTRKLKQFDDRFAGVENLRTLVSTLSSDVGAVKGNVATLGELRKSLSDAAGNAIDIAKMRDDVVGLQGLRENLKGADGDLLRLRDVDVKLRELSDAVGVGAAGALDARIGAVVAGAEGRLDGKLDGKLAERATALQATFQAGVAASETKLRGELTSGIAASRATLDQSVVQQVAAAEVRLNTQFDGKLTQATTAVRADTLAATGGLLDTRLATLPDQVRTVATSLVDGMRTGLRDELKGGLTADLDAKLGTLDNRLSTRVGVLDTRVSGVETRLPGLVAARVDEVGQTLETRLNQRVDASADATRQSLQSTLGAQVKTAVADSVGNLDAHVAASVDGRLANLDTRVVQAVSAATRNLPQDVGSEVSRQIATLNVPGQIKDASAAVAQQLRTEQAQAIADVQAKTSSAVNNAVTVLRGEMSAQRTETLSTIDTRVNASNAGLRKEFGTSLSSLQGTIKPDAFRTGTLSPIVLRPIG